MVGPDRLGHVGLDERNLIQVHLRWGRRGQQRPVQPAVLLGRGRGALLRRPDQFRHAERGDVRLELHPAAGGRKLHGQRSRQRRRQFADERLRQLLFPRHCVYLSDRFSVPDGRTEANLSGQDLQRPRRPLDRAVQQGGASSTGAGLRHGAGRQRQHHRPGGIGFPCGWVLCQQRHSDAVRLWPCHCLRRIHQNSHNLRNLDRAGLGHGIHRLRHHQPQRRHDYRLPYDLHPGRDGRRLRDRRQPVVHAADQRRELRECGQLRHVPHGHQRF